MVRYKRSNVTAKTGVNFVRSLIEGQGCLFHKIEQENDLGIDALIELFKDERPLNKQIAAQIKSGQAYYSPGSEECLIPVDNHRDYWSGYPLPVIGVVYVPSLARAYWVDVKRYLKLFPTASVIRFMATEASRLDGSVFQTRFLPTLLHEVPDIPFDQALALLHSTKPSESYLGLVVIFRRYSNRRETWTALVEYFTVRSPDDIPPILIYYLSHIPWHPDIVYQGEQISRETRDYAKELLQRFGRSEILKLLDFIDTENMISRGSIGQSLEALISSLPHSDPVLESIAGDANVELFSRECAAFILAMHLGKSALPTLQALAASGSWYAAELVNYVQQYGEVNPYG
jgi:hypothetical protein